MIIKVIIDRIEGDKAVLKSDDGVSLIWPKDKLPSQMHEGTALVFEISTEDETEAKGKKNARDILNELLKTD